MTRQQRYIFFALLTLGVMAVFVTLVAILVSVVSPPSSPPVPASPMPDEITPPTSLPTSLTPLPFTPTFPIPSEQASPTQPPTAEPSATIVIPTLTPTPHPWIEQQLGRFTLADKIGQMIMMGIDGQVISAYTCQLIVDIAPGSVVYVYDNVITPDQLRQFSADLQNCNNQNLSSVPLWIAMDHEGQYVYRYDYGATVFPAAMAFGAAGDLDLAFRAALGGGQELAYSGVNMVLGPDADLLTNYDNDVISLRAYGGDPLVAGEFVASMVLGYQAAGVIPVLKHFPGHGGVAADSHYTLPVDSASLDALHSTYLPPFQRGIEAGARVVMFSHVSFPSIDASGLPASLSPAINSLLRLDMSFQGVVLTDSLGMGAITGETSIPEASLQAVLAGTDMLLIASPEVALQARDRLVSAVQSGELPVALVDAAVRRILTVKAASGRMSYPLPQPATPNWAGNATLAYQVGYQAVTLLRDDTSRLPLPGSRVLLIGPADGWGMYPVLQSALIDNGYWVETVRYSGPWNGAVPETGYLTSMPAYSANFDVTVVLTWQSHLNHLLYNDNFQINLVNNLLATGRPVVVVALKSPVDILDFPSAPTYLMTFGTTDGQLQAMADILVGEAEAVGRNPLPGLP
jgi:beta-N-acetylhexosaminidase